jgi:prefoldin beta subunit
MNKDVQEKIQKLQGIEENLHNYLGQKQQVQQQLMELESATEALETAKSSYRIIGNIMIEQPAEDVKKFTGEKMERLKVRVDSLSKQEEKLKSQAEKLQQEIMAGMKETGE